MPNEPGAPIPTEKQHASPFMLFLLISVVPMLALGAGGYYLGWAQGHAGIQESTLRVSVQSPGSTDLTAQILVNGKMKDTLSIPRGQTASIDEQVTFAASEGAYFVVEAIASNGLHASSRVLVTGPGIYPVSLGFG